MHDFVGPAGAGTCRFRYYIYRHDESCRHYMMRVPRQMITYYAEDYHCRCGAMPAICQGRLMAAGQARAGFSTPFLAISADGAAALISRAARQPPARR